MITSARQLKFKRDNYLVNDLEWDEVISSVEAFSKEIIPYAEELSLTEDESEDQTMIFS